MRYPGGKGGAGIAQRIISMMPPHDRYIGPYLGGGRIFYTKRPAASSIVNDADVDVIRYHQRDPRPSTTYVTGDAISLLASLQLTTRDLVYLDPPYHPSTRSKAKLYNVEADDAHHVALMAALRWMPCMVILSGYRCALYDEALQGWHRTDYIAQTRGGPREESAWCNFVPGLAFHDPRFVGADFRERERIKRKRARWVSRFTAMAPGERALIAEALSIAAGGER